MKNRENIRISVCMASYNGEMFILEQLNSILAQLGDQDEIVIIDDKSKDSTVFLIKSLNDSRIRLFVNEKNLGVNKSFERAIRLATGRYIFMSDQDDIWTPDRVSVMLDSLIKDGSIVVSGNTEAIDAQGNAIKYNFGKLFKKDSTAYKQNIRKIFLGKAYYYGCAMAFSSELKNIILPFPRYLESHDLWIAMAANILKSNTHLESIVLKRRIHGNNASVINRNIFKKLNSRIIFTKSYFKLKKRVKQNIRID